MVTLTIDSAAVRGRFSALGREVAFFDAPGGTQVPDEVIGAISGYLRESNANLGGAFEASRRSDLLVGEARRTAARFLGCGAEEVVFGANMTTLNFALSRTAARELEAGDEIIVTRLDHDGNIAPWLELAADLGLRVRFAEIRDDASLDLDHLASLLSERTRIVAYPWASNAVGTLVDVTRVAALAHEAGALAWVDAVHYAPHGPIDVAAAGVDVLLCSPYKFFGRTSGSPSPAPSCWSAGARTRSAPRRSGRSAPASRPEPWPTSCSPASLRPSGTSSRSGSTRSSPTSGSSARASWRDYQSRAGYTVFRRWRAECPPSA